MKSIERIEAYLQGEMTEQERAAFDELRAMDPELDQQVVAHQAFLAQLKDYGNRHHLISEMNAIHEMLDIDAIKEEVLPKRSLIKVLWSKYRVNAAIAASVAILAAFSTLLSTGYFSRTNALNDDYNALRRQLSKITNIQKSQSAQMNDIRGNASGPANPGQFGGTGFALSADGYLVTNYHVIKGADSVYIQNTAGESYKVKTVYVHPQYDIAVLQITDPHYKALKALPYTFKKSSADVAEEVFTIGFPREDPVYNRGYLSANTGYRGDTVAYQVDIPVNEGNSGGPLLDSKGNVIGIINAKQARTDGATFAVKSGYLLEALESIPKDSLNTELVLNKKNNLSNLSRKDQYKKMQDYVFMVKVYQ